MTDSINEWLYKARQSGLSDEEIEKQLAASGWPSGDIEHLFKNPGDPAPSQLRGIDRLKTDKKAQTFQHLLIGWFIINILLRFGLVGFVFSSAFSKIDAPTGFTTGLWIMMFMLLIPAIIVLIGIIKVKAWAYWLYLIVLFFSLFPSGIPESVVSLIVMVISILGSATAFFITIFLYSRLFPSKRAQRVVGS